MHHFLEATTFPIVIGCGINCSQIDGVPATQQSRYKMAATRVSPTKNYVPHYSIKKTHPEENLVDALRLNYFYSCMIIPFFKRVNDFQAVSLWG